MKTMDCNVHRYLAINIAGKRTTLSQVSRDDLRRKSQINFIPYLPCRNCSSCPFLLSLRHLSIAITTGLILHLEIYRFRSSETHKALKLLVLAVTGFCPASIVNDYNLVRT